MTTPSALTCEVLIGGGWHTISLNKAKTLHGDAIKRCSACHGRVTVSGIYSAQGHLTLSHRRTHDGCSLIPRHYKGESKRHPDALK